MPNQNEIYIIILLFSCIKNCYDNHAGRDGPSGRNSVKGGLGNDDDDNDNDNT